MTTVKTSKKVTLMLIQRLSTFSSGQHFTMSIKNTTVGRRFINGISHSVNKEHANRHFNVN